MIPRYTRPDMAAIWETDNKFRIMLEVETLAAEIQEKAVTALTSPKGQAGLAKLLVDAFGGQFDLEMATKLIAMLKDNPTLLDQLNEALAKLPTAENK